MHRHRVGGLRRNEACQHERVRVVDDRISGDAGYVRVGDGDDLRTPGMMAAWNGFLSGKGGGGGESMDLERDLR